MTANNKIVIVGAGLAGLFTAIKLAPIKVDIITSKSLGSGTSSQWAQAGIAAVMSEIDSTNSHLEDTIKVGGGIVNKKLAKIVIENGPNRVRDLLDLGVPFDKNDNNQLILRKEAAHKHNRIVSVSGDMTGKKIMETLTTIVKNSSHINVIEGYNAVELHQNNNKIVGLSIQKNHEKKLLKTDCIVLASGGIGQLYKTTTNSKEAMGEGVGMAAGCGALLSDMEFVQFHPTAFDLDIDPAPLATEALRGEGATIINNKNNRFLFEYHESGELAPRDIVSRAIFQEQKKGNTVYLDCRGKLGENMQKNFPTVHAICSQNNINPSIDPIPITPAAHYHMGGILCDENGKSSVNGLYVCGENACTGIHGANRLASNSLLEAIVFGNIIATNIKEEINNLTNQAGINIKTNKQDFINLQKIDMDKLRSIMTKYVGVERNQEGLEEAYRLVLGIYKSYKDRGCSNNSLITALLIIKSAMKRKEHRGSHYRSDYPGKNDNYKSSSKINLKELAI